jgi:hypothetical protein
VRRMRPLLSALLSLGFALGCLGCEHRGSAAYRDVSGDGQQGDAPAEVDAPSSAGCREDADCQRLEGLGPCRRARCLAGVGACVIEPVPEGAPCDPGAGCFKDAICVDGVCEGSALDCDDENPCTEDSCDGDEGGCVHEPLEGDPPCDDGSLCTSDDHCALGFCVGEPVVCPHDGGACTTARCEADTGWCVTEVLEGEACDDGSACTFDDRCDADGVCQGEDALCDDGDPCTWDGCDPQDGSCRHEPHDGVTCDDGDPCTLDDHCLDGDCVGAPLDCDDGDPCTEDLCPVQGDACAHVPLDGAGCDDGDACTAGDACVEGVCLGGAPIEGCCSLDADCEDGDGCTVDTCVANACVSAPMVCPGAGPCAYATCVDGACVGSALSAMGLDVVLYTGFEAASTPGVTVLGGSIQAGSGSAYQGDKLLRATYDGTVLRLSDLFMPGGTSLLTLWVRPTACSGTGVQVTVDGATHDVGCPTPYRWSPVTLPLSSDQDKERDVEILWSGSGTLDLDEISVTSVGAAGCLAGAAPSEVSAGLPIIDQDVWASPATGLWVGYVRRLSDSLFSGFYAARPDGGAWIEQEWLVEGALSGDPNHFSLDFSLDDQGRLAAAWGPNLGGDGASLYVGGPDGLPLAQVSLAALGGATDWPILRRLRSGRLLAGWTAEQSGPWTWFPRVQLFDADGGSVGDPWTAAPTGALMSGGLALAELDTGHRAVVWSDDGVIRLSVREPSGNYAADGVLATPDGVSAAAAPAMASLPQGKFVVIWEQSVDGRTSLAGRVFDIYGTVIAGPFPISWAAEGDQRRPAVVADDQGRFAVTWDSDHLQAGVPQPMIRSFNVAGDGDVEQALDPYGPSGQDVSLALYPPYHLVTSWRSGHSVRARVMGMDCSQGHVICQSGVAMVCVGEGYAPLAGQCSGDACLPGPCP